ncbi:hypothetical protein M422DRAFT_35064, partial [Sphaerobolus stellatus SS14]
MATDLQSLPFEVLDQIGYFAATSVAEGPPTDVTALSQVCRLFYKCLSFEHNQGLYSSIFHYKFDTKAVRRRFGSDILSPPSSTEELRARFQTLKRLRSGVGQKALLRDGETQLEDLWRSVIMMLEFGHLSLLASDKFCKLTFIFSLEMDGKIDPAFNEIVRSYAVNALKYTLTPAHWTEFQHPCKIGTGLPIPYFNQRLTLTSPPISIPAVQAHVERVLLGGISTTVLHGMRSAPRTGIRRSSKTKNHSSEEWDLDWLRCQGLSRENDEDSNTAELDTMIQKYHKPGGFDGAWQGIFTYTDFGVYAAIFSGESTAVLQDGAIGHNHQTWRLREYDLFSSDKEYRPFELGDPSEAFFPIVFGKREEDDYVVLERGDSSTQYQRVQRGFDSSDKGELRDIVLFGEGHSSWGDFKLKGRVRPGDGLVSVLKEY